MTTIRVADPHELSGLIAMLERHDCVCTRLDDATVQVSLLGSFGTEAHALEVELRLRAWEAAHPGAHAELVH